MISQLETDFVKLEKAFNRLKTVSSWPESHDGRVEANIQCFEFTVELYWKLLKHMLKLKDVSAHFPRDALKEAFAAGWVDNEETLAKMITDRNLTSHTYNENLANEILARIPNYISLIDKNLVNLKKIAEDMKSHE